jgi:hypothetical protein
MAGADVAGMPRALENCVNCYDKGICPGGENAMGAGR